MRRSLAALVVACALLLGASAVSHGGFTGVTHDASHQLLGIIWGDAK